MGGIDNAVALVKQAADIPADEQVTAPGNALCCVQPFPSTFSCTAYLGCL